MVAVLKPLDEFDDEPQTKYCLICTHPTTAKHCCGWPTSACPEDEIAVMDDQEYANWRRDAWRYRQIECEA